MRCVNLRKSEDVKGLFTTFGNKQAAHKQITLKRKSQARHLIVFTQMLLQNESMFDLEIALDCPPTAPS